MAKAKTVFRKRLTLGQVKAYRSRAQYEKNGFSDLKSSCYQIILMEFGTNNGSNNCSLFQ